MFLVYHGAMQRLLISFGLLLTAIGLLWPWLSKLPFGRFTTLIVLSLVLSLIVRLLRRSPRQLIHPALRDSQPNKRLKAHVVLLVCSSIDFRRRTA